MSNNWVVCAGWSGVRVWVERRTDDCDRAQTQRRRHHRHGARSGTHEVHLPRTYRGVQHPRVERREDMRHRRTAARLQRGGGS